MSYRWTIYSSVRINMIEHISIHVMLLNLSLITAGNTWWCQMYLEQYGWNKFMSRILKEKIDKKNKSDRNVSYLKVIHDFKYI